MADPFAGLSFLPKGKSGQLFAGQGTRLKFYDESDKFFQRLGRKTTRVLTLTGSDVRRAVRRSLVKRPRKTAIRRFKEAIENRRQFRGSSREVEEARKHVVSPPGKPPFQHTGKLRDLVFYAVDTTRLSMVVGPVEFSGKSTSTEGKTGAELLETGGRILIAGSRNKYAARVKARPYMEPHSATGQQETVIKRFNKHMEKENL